MQLKKKLPQILVVLLVLTLLPIINAETTFFEGDYFITEVIPPTTIPNQGGGSFGTAGITIYCYKIVNNACTLEGFINNCTNGYFKYEKDCESNLTENNISTIQEKFYEIIDNFPEIIKKETDEENFLFENFPRLKEYKNLQWFRDTSNGFLIIGIILLVIFVWMLRNYKVLGEPS